MVKDHKTHNDIFALQEVRAFKVRSAECIFLTGICGLQQLQAQGQSQIKA